MKKKSSLVLLAMSRLNVLAGKDRVVVDDVLSRADVGLGVGIELLGLAGEVEVDGVGPSEGDYFTSAIWI